MICPRVRVLLLTLLLPSAGFPCGQTPPGTSTHAASTNSYVIAVQDVLNVTTWEHEDLSGKIVVQPDGTITFPLLGRVPAAGLTVPQLEAQLTGLLRNGFVNSPRLTIALDQYRGPRIFVFGNVVTPGTYPLPEGRSLIEALVKAGYAAAAEAIVIRPRHPSGPVLPEHAGDAEVFRVNLRDLEKDVEHGSLARNVRLMDGDTIFVPRTDPRSVFVTGQVRNPGAYSIAEGTTVLQALALAGGATEQASLGRLRILRLVNGKQTNVKVSLTAVVRAGDTVIVPERFF